jgi:hypothetical protein
VEGLVEAVNGRLAAQVTQAARSAGPLLIVLVSASCGSSIGGPFLAAVTFYIVVAEA